MIPGVAYLLIILQLGNPIPMFAIPMTDAEACKINMVAMMHILKENANAICFDLASQTFHGVIRHVDPEEHVD